MRKQLAAIAVAALLVFAGCSAVGDGDGTTTAPGTTGATPSDTTTDDDGNGDAIYDSPLDAATVAENHDSAIRDSGTFTLLSTSNQSQGPQSFGVVASIAADLETGEFFSRQNASNRVVETYGYGNGTAYQRLQLSENETEYVIPQQTPNASQLANSDIRSFVNTFSFDHVGTETVDGTSTDVYEANGTEDLNESAPGFEDLDTENVSSIDARVYVADDGLVKQFQYNLTVATGNGGEATISVQQRYTEVGSTTVEAPSWLDEARANTSE